MPDVNIYLKIQSRMMTNNITAYWNMSEEVTLSNFLHICPHFMCCKYFHECFKNKNLLYISLTKFNKLNKRRKRTFSINQFTFALYLAFIFCTFSVYLWRIVWSTSVSVQFFWLEVKKCVVTCLCWVVKNSVLHWLTWLHWYFVC